CPRAKLDGIPRRNDAIPRPVPGASPLAVTSLLNVKSPRLLSLIELKSERCLMISAPQRNAWLPEIFVQLVEYWKTVLTSKRGSAAPDTVPPNAKELTGPSTWMLASPELIKSPDELMPFMPTWSLVRCPASN